MANITTQTIRVDLSTDKVLPTAFTHQNDTARTLVFDMYNGGMPYTMTGNTVKFAYKSPIVNGQYSVIAGASMVSGTVSGNKVTVTLPSAYTAISGVGMLTMIITPSSGTVRPVNIRLVVQKSADGDDAIAGASDFPTTLQQIADEWYDENIANWLNENIESVYDAEAFGTAIDSWLDDHPEATTTVQDGALTEPKFSNALKLKTIKDYVTPEMYGGTGDGVADDTSSFVAACNSGKPVYVNNSKIGACSIENCEIKCNKLIITGVITCKSVDLCGNVDVDGGSFLIYRTSSDIARDDSNFEKTFFNIINCDTLFTVKGTLYNPRFLNLTVRAKCNVSVFTFDAEEWITYTLIKDCFLGTCDTPIIIKGKVDGLQIINTFAQRYEPSGACRFITTGARGCKLVLSSSFMYDLVSDTNDTQIYLDRGSSGDFNYGQKFLISVNGQCGGSPSSAQFAQDSNGSYGFQLANEISHDLNDLNGSTIIKRPIKNARSAFDFYENITDFTSYGSAIDVAIPDALTSAGTDVVGVAYKFGTGNNAKSAEVIIGTKANGDIVTIRRDADDQTFKVKGYTDTSNFVGSAEAPSALITDLNTIPVNFIGTKRLDASISPTGSAFHAPMVRFGNRGTGGIFAVRPTSGTLYFAALNGGTWGAWKTVTLT